MSVVSPHSQTPTNTLSATSSQEEVVPLLREHFDDNGETSVPNDDDYNSFNDSSKSFSSDSDGKSFLERQGFSKKRFWLFCSLGVVAIIALHLSFLPRTSLSRDFRRWHGLRLTKSDIKRSYLAFTGFYGNHPNHETVLEEYTDYWLKNLTEINSKYSYNLIGSDNCKLVSYVEKQFGNFGAQTEKFLYPFDKLQGPSTLSIRLLDANRKVIYNGNLLEKNYKTPAYNSFGFNGTVRSNYVFVNEGTYEDYTLLVKNKISLTGKIFIAKTTANVTVAEQVQISQHFGASGFIVYSNVQLADKDKQNSIKTSIPRSSVVFDTFGGDDLKHLKLSSIPSIPISLKSITPILNTLLGVSPPTSAFSNWDFLPVTADSAGLEIELTSVFRSPKARQELINIVGSYKGILSDGEIIIGASRDSFTSSNPLSGHAILFEIMRNFQKLTSLGWKPLRTIKFVSWDGSKSGLLGALISANDSSMFSSRQPILSYINLDSDVISGSKLKVDANPLFNDILEKTAKYILIPKDSRAYKSLPNDDESNDDDNEDYNIVGGDNLTTLYHYWLKQDKVSINNILGNQLKTSDALIFQNHLETPVINIKFENDPKRDSAIYLPNSNYYSYDWLIKQEIDDDLLLHGTLIRYLGLLIISLSDHEIVDTRTNDYASKVNKFFDYVIVNNYQVLNEWSHHRVSSFLLNKFSIYNDIRSDENYTDDAPINFNMLMDQLQKLMNDLFKQSLIFDDYVRSVENQLIEDFAWYKLLKKVHIFAKFKVANYKLLRLEHELNLKTSDYTYLYGEKTSKEMESKNIFNHIIYGIPKFAIDRNASFYQQRNARSVFPYLQEAINDNDFDLTVKWIVILYEKFKNINKKIA